MIQEASLTPKIVNFKQEFQSQNRPLSSSSSLCLLANASVCSDARYICLWIGTAFEREMRKREEIVIIHHGREVET